MGRGDRISIRLDANFLAKRAKLMQSIKVTNFKKFDAIVVERIVSKFKDITFEPNGKIDKKQTVCKYTVPKEHQELITNLKENLGVNFTQLYISEVITMSLEQKSN